jgi:hypothetical protein
MRRDGDFIPRRGEIVIRKFLITNIPVLALALVVFAAPASAGPPMPASGTYHYTLAPDFAGARPAGTNLFIPWQAPVVLTGTFSGTGLFLDSPTYTFHADGSFQFSERLQFDGTVAGCGSGTVVFQFEANAVFVNGITTWSPHNHLTALSGQGTLPVHANLDLTGDSDPGGLTATLALSGQYDC